LESTCYKTTNSSIFFLNTTTYPLQTNLQRPNNETFRKAVDTILLRGNVTDDCGLVSGATTNSADMTATLGGPEAAKEAKRKVLYNVLGGAYEKVFN
jgi:hypothetical protein